MVAWLVARRKLLWNRILEYFYPAVFLVGLEFIMRSLTSSPDALAFIGPTLAVIGIHLMLPLIRAKSLTGEQLLEEIEQRAPDIAAVDVDTVKDIINKTVKEVNKKDSKRTSGILALAALTLIWAWAMYLSLKFPQGFWWVIPLSLCPGLINYFTGSVLSLSLEEV